VYTYATLSIKIINIDTEKPLFHICIRFNLYLKEKQVEKSNSQLVKYIYTIIYIIFTIFSYNSIISFEVNFIG